MSKNTDYGTCWVKGRADFIKGAQHKGRTFPGGLRTPPEIKDGRDNRDDKYLHSHARSMRGLRQALGQ